MTSQQMTICQSRERMQIAYIQLMRNVCIQLKPQKLILKPPTRLGMVLIILIPIEDMKTSYCGGSKEGNSSDGGSSSGQGEGGGGNDSGSGGDGGGDDDDDDDDGESSMAIATFQLEWWQISVMVAAIITVATLLIMFLVCRPNRFYVPVLITSFLMSFGLSMYFNPKLWFRRMAEICFSALVGCNFLGGLSLTIPIPSLSTPLICQLPEAHWSLNLALGFMCFVFGIIHYFREK